MWDPADPVLTNLERVLGVEMPGPADSSREEWGVECGICYTYKLEDRLPNKTCDDTRYNSSSRVINITRLNITVPQITVLK